MTALVVPLHPERAGVVRIARGVLCDPDHHDLATVEAAREVLAAWGGPGDAALLAPPPPFPLARAINCMIAGAVLAVVAYLSGYGMAALMAAGV